MCAGIEFEGERIMWAGESPQLPLLLKDGSIGWGIWGQPYQDVAIAAVPKGGWARLESIKDGKWKRFKPLPVKIPATAFMERARDGSEVWFPITDGLVIQGAAIAQPNQLYTAERGKSILRIYVVTQPAIGDVAAVHDRMPRLVPKEKPPVGG